VLSVTLNEAETTALVKVPDKHLSLAIGKEGQNVRLAAKLTGWRIDIKSASDLEAARALQKEEAAEKLPPAEEKPLGDVTEVVGETAESAAPGEAETVEPASAVEEPAEGAGIEILMPVEAAASAKPSRIRFAEEIMSGRDGKSKKKEAVKKEEVKDAGAKAKSVKPKKKTYYEDEDFES